MNLRIAFACFGLATATALSAQTTTRHHELGIQLEQSYGFMYGVPMNFKTLYKVGASDKAVWRFQVGICILDSITMNPASNALHG
jgi:hypothetical protein